MTSLTRRLALKFIGIGTAWLGISKATPAQESSLAAEPDATTVSWKNTHDRVWLSGEIWANPMEDWRVVDGAAECQSTGGNRNLQLITHQLTNPAGSIMMSVVAEQVEARKQDGGVGFRVGIQSDLNEYRSNSFAAGGLNAGWIDGQMILGRKQAPLDIDIKKTVNANIIKRWLFLNIHFPLNVPHNFSFT